MRGQKQFNDLTRKDSDPGLGARPGGVLFVHLRSLSMIAKVRMGGRRRTDLKIVVMEIGASESDRDGPAAGVR